MSATLFPLTSLVAEHRELGLVVAVLLGIGFGFTLERSGFGQAPNLAAQFYLRDMRVFKVMFSAILTAMVGLVLLSGLGLADLAAIRASAVSYTFVWPMLVGGLLLGAGFIISGYCPGTSAVATASGNLDGLVTFLGVILGSVLFGEVFDASAAVRSFHASGAQEQLFLYDLLGLPPTVLALLVTAMALALFLGAEAVERLMARRREAEAPEHATARAARPRRLAFSALGLVALLGLLTLALPGKPQASEPRRPAALEAAALARRTIDEPWTLRVLDLRPAAQCQKKAVPGAECVGSRGADGLGLAYAAGERDLVLVDAEGKAPAPAAALAYPGRVFALRGGFEAWRRYALSPAPPPPAGASEEQLAAYRFRVGLQSVLTGIKPPPPPQPAGGVKFVPTARKAKGGGCG